MKKRGLSAVITTLIIILLVLVAIGVVWVVISNLITQGAEEISLGKFTINMQINNIKINSDGTIDVTVKRNTGKGDLTGIKFLVNDGVEVSEFEEPTTIGELGQQTFNLNYNGLIKDVSIAPIFKLESGKESLGDEVHKQVIPKQKIIQNSGAVSWWRFEGNANDEVGDNHGTNNGATISSGKYGSAYSFNGIDNYIEIPDDNTLDITDEITLSAWIYTNTPVNGYVLSKQHPSPISGPYAIVISDDVGRYDFRFNGNDYRSNFNHFNQWVHVVSTYSISSGEVKNYINGTLISTFSQTNPIQTNNENLQIARRIPSNYYFNGLIDEIMIFNRALSAEEVKALYNLDLS